MYTYSTMKDTRQRCPIAIRQDTPFDGESLSSYGLIRRSVMKVLDTILLAEVQHLTKYSYGIRALPKF